MMTRKYIGRTAIGECHVCWEWLPMSRMRIIGDLPLCFGCIAALQLCPTLADGYRRHQNLTYDCECHGKKTEPQLPPWLVVPG